MQENIFLTNAYGDYYDSKLGKNKGLESRELVFLRDVLLPNVFGTKEKIFKYGLLSPSSGDPQYCTNSCASVQIL